LREESSINSRGQNCREEGRVAPEGGRSRESKGSAGGGGVAATRQTRATRQRRKRQEGERREWDDREVA